MPRPLSAIPAACSLLALLGVVFPCHASDGNIGIFADVDATTTSLSIPCGGNARLYVYGLLDGASASGFTGAEFSVEVAGAGGFAWLFQPNPTADVVLGGPLPPSDGVNISWSTCQTGDGAKVLLGEIIAFNLGCNAGETHLRVVKHQSPSNMFFQCPLFTLCDSPVFTKVCLGDEVTTVQCPDPPFPVACMSSSSGEFTLNPAQEVAVDIRPQGCPNPLSPRSRGFLPVAVLGASDFDVLDIDVSTVRLQGVSAIASSIDDVARPFVGSDCGCTDEGPDGHPDLVLRFDNSEVASTLGVGPSGEQPLVLTGQLTDGTSIKGSDCIVVPPVGSASNEPASPGTPGLAAAEPNPFHGVTRIRYSLREAAAVRLTVYDVSGRVVREFDEGVRAAGRHDLRWDARDLIPGVYFYRLRAGTLDQTRSAIVTE